MQKIQLLRVTPRLLLLSHASVQNNHQELLTQLSIFNDFTIFDLTNNHTAFRGFEGKIRQFQSSWPVKLEQLLAVCYQAFRALSKNNCDVLVLMTSNSKSKAKLYVSALLLFLGLKGSAEQASDFYDIFRKTKISMRPLIKFQQSLKQNKLKNRTLYLKRVRLEPQFIIASFTVQRACSRVIYEHNIHKEVESFLYGLSDQKFHKQRLDWSYLQASCIIKGDTVIRFYDLANFKSQFVFQIVFNTADVQITQGKILLDWQSIQPVWLAQSAAYPKQIKISLQVKDYCQCKGDCQECTKYGSMQLSRELLKKRPKEMNPVELLWGSQTLYCWQECSFELQSQQKEDRKLWREQGKFTFNCV